jgi:hypothetical protein
MRGMKRRLFLASTALSASRVFGANHRVRIAFVGCPRHGHHLARLMSHASNVEYVVAASTADFRRFLDHQGIDAVHLAMPGHPSILAQACAAGKDVYLETWEPGDWQVADHHPHLVIQAGMPHRSSPRTEELRRTMGSRIRFVRAGNRLTDIDTVHAILGDGMPRSVSATGCVFTRQTTVEYPSALVSYESSCEGPIVLHAADGRVIEHRNEDATRLHAANFIDCVRARATPNSPLAAVRRSVEVARLAEAAYRSGRRIGCTVAGAPSTAGSVPADVARTGSPVPANTALAVTRPPG